ncbi:MAG: acyl-CoA thioesterase [Neisseriaceae bacterium]|nr:acyl-CoA thioesterase [Neisseriaceae bacterium]
MKDTIIKVRGYHLDIYQHVNNARYLEFLEEARWALFDDSGALKLLGQKNWGFAVVNININFRRAATMGDILRINTKFGDFSSKSGTLTQTITNLKTEKIMTEAQITYVILDLNTNRALPINEEIRTILNTVIS